MMLAPSLGLSCRCDDVTAKEAWEKADVVFAGMVTNVKYVDTKGDKIFGEQRIIVTIKVDGYWKGKIGRIAILHTVYNRVSCDGFPFRKGRKNLVYATKRSARGWLEAWGRTAPKGADMPKREWVLDTSICSGTKFFVNDKDIRDLGPYKVPKH